MEKHELKSFNLHPQKVHKNKKDKDKVRPEHQKCNADECAEVWERDLCGKLKDDKRAVGSRQSSGSKGCELFLFSGFCSFCPCQLMKGLIISPPTTHYHHHSKKDNSIYFYDRASFWGLDEICYLSRIRRTVWQIFKNSIKTK